MIETPLNFTYRFYESLSRKNKRWLLMAIDVLIFWVSISLAMAFRNATEPTPDLLTDASRIFLLIAVKLLIFQLKGIYRPILRYTGLEFISNFALAVLISYLCIIFLVYLTGAWPIPRGVLLFDALLTLVLVVGVRILIRSGCRQLDVYVQRKIGTKQVVIYGAGRAGSQLAKALSHDSIYQVVAFVDDNPEYHYQIVEGYKVYSPSQLIKIWEQLEFELLILAMPNLRAERKREIIENLNGFPITVKTIPPIRQLISGDVSINQLRNIDVTELLGREEVMPYPELLSLNVTGKNVLITGAGGSIGSELCRQIAQLKPKCLVLYEINEYSLYRIDLELGESYSEVKRFSYLGNVTDQPYFENILKLHQVDTIYHTAAYKHVPLVESNSAQGVYNNVMGSWSTASSAIKAGVKNYVLISTDKAVRPTNVMGASKRVAELVIQALAEQRNISTRFAMVRFGNVLDSSGSVVPRFREQIAQGKPITVTHPDITRYFMSIPEAIRLVMQAGAMAKGGEVFLLDMGEPVRIHDLAIQMIRLSGLEPGRDIEIKFTGLRPGEKLYEELLIDGDNIQPTKHPKIYCANEYKIPWPELEPKLEKLLLNARINNTQALIKDLCILVPEYQPKKRQKIETNGSQDRKPSQIEKKQI